MSVTSMSPVFLAPGGRRVAVFGGGAVALRKCRHFRGFRIRVIAPSILPELRELADECVVAAADEDSVRRHIADADIVVAATDSHRLNDSIRDISMSMGKMTNSAHGGGDVLIPSVLRRPGYTVTVSSEGRVPAFPPYVIRQLDAFLDPSYDGMMDLLVHLRGIIRDRIPTQPGRAEYLARVLDDEDIWHMLRSGDPEGARIRAEGMIP